METNVRVKEAMSTPLIVIEPKATSEAVAKKMAENNIGSIIVTKNGNNAGIVTERDICYKVVANRLDPTKTLAQDIMSTNLVTIPSNKTITDAAKLMVNKGIRRLAVFEDEKIKGILTASDILSVSPRTIEILRELYEIYSNPEESLKVQSEEISEGGTCDECATFTDNLIKVDGRYLCDDCREELED